MVSYPKFLHHNHLLMVWVIGGELYQQLHHLWRLNSTDSSYLKNLKGSWRIWSDMNFLLQFKYSTVQLLIGCWVICWPNINRSRIPCPSLGHRWHMENLAIVVELHRLPHSPTLTNNDTHVYHWHWNYPLVNVYITNWKDPPCLMGKLTISMAIFNSNVTNYQRVSLFGSCFFDLFWPKASWDGPWKFSFSFPRETAKNHVERKSPFIVSFNGC